MAIIINIDCHVGEAEMSVTDVAEKVGIIDKEELVQALRVIVLKRLLIPS